MKYLKISLQIIALISFALLTSYLVVLSIPYGALCTMAVLVISMLVAVIWIFSGEFMHEISRE